MAVGAFAPAGGARGGGAFGAAGVGNAGPFRVVAGSGVAVPTTIAGMAALATARRKQQQHGIGGFFHNLIRNVEDTVYGLPRFAVWSAGEIGRLPGAVASEALRSAGVNVPTARVPGLGVELLPHPQRLGRELETAVGGIASDYRKAYGPAVGAWMRGHPLGAIKALGHSFYEDPLYRGLDVATAVTGVGEAVNLGARAAIKAGIAVDAADAARAGEAGALVRRLAAR